MVVRAWKKVDVRVVVKVGELDQLGDERGLSQG